MNTIYLYALVILFLYGTFCLINTILTTIPTLIIQILILYYILKTICYILIYPGSFKLYLRINQNHYGQLYAKRLLQNIQELEDIIDQKTHPTSELFEWFEEQTKLYTSIQQYSQLQLKYQNSLKSLQTILKTTQDNKLIINFLLEGQPIQNTINEQIKLILNNLKVLANYHTEQVGKYESIKRWCSLQLFGGLNEMRARILLINPLAKRYILFNGNNQIDCMYLINSNIQPNNTILFCNPNGGYYEYMFYDCNWFRYYENKKINVIIWNYRQYGQSTGTLNPKSLLEDASIIVNYFRERHNIQRFGIQGYSLGGSIASEIALLNNLDFLIVDRTFSSIGQIASKTFNSQIRFILNIVTNWDKPHYMNYWNYKGQKLIIQDSKDEIIPYEAQMQVAIAKEWFSPYKETYFNKMNTMFDRESYQFKKFFENNILSKTQMRSLGSSFMRILTLLYKLFKLLEQQENNEERIIYHLNGGQRNQYDYARFITDDELERLQPILLSLSEILYQLRYNNTSLIELLLSNQNNFEEKIQCFFACCFTFGLQESQNFISQFQLFKQAIRDFLTLEGQQLNWKHIQNDVEIIIENLQKIVDRFSEYLDDSQQTLNETMRGINIEMQLTPNYMTKIGKLVNVQCGHNNNLTEIDFGFINGFFRQIGIN